MQVPMCKTHIEMDAETFFLENVYRSLEEKLGHPAEDLEICNAMQMTLDEFHQALDRVKGINVGIFQKMAPRAGDTNDDPLVKYIPDTSQTDSSFMLRESEIRGVLTRAIEALPRMEQIIASLYYYEELTMREIEAVLGMSEGCISQLHTKAMLRLRSKLMSEQRTMPAK